MSNILRQVRIFAELKNSIDFNIKRAIILLHNIVGLQQQKQWSPSLFVVFRILVTGNRDEFSLRKRLMTLVKFHPWVIIWLQCIRLSIYEPAKLHGLRACVSMLKRALRAYVLKLQRLLHAHVPTCFACLHAHVSMFLACLRVHLPTYFVCLRAHVPMYFVYLRARLPACLACLHDLALRALRAHVPTWLVYLGCLHAHLL